MAKVFISYARVDDTYAEEISSALAEFGHTVYSDTLLIPGASWENALDRALRESDVLVSIITPQSNTSAFVLAELGAGLSFSRESGRMLVVPVVVGGAEIPAPLRGIQAIFDATGSKARQVASDIDQAISAFVGSRAAAEQKQEEARQRIEKNAAEYVDETVRAQRTAGKRYRTLVVLCYVVLWNGRLQRWHAPTMTASRRCSSRSTA